MPPLVIAPLVRLALGAVGTGVVLALGGERGAPRQRGARSSEGGERSGRPRKLPDVTARPAHRRMARDARRMTPLALMIVDQTTGDPLLELTALELFRVT